MNKNVLVLDDHPNILILLERILELDNHKVFKFESPDKALEFLQEKKEHIDIMFIDFMLPIMDGLEFMHEVKSDEVLQEIPIYMISSHTGDLIKKKADDIGASGFINKPIDSRALLELVQRTQGSNDPEEVH